MRTIRHAANHRALGLFGALLACVALLALSVPMTLAVEPHAVRPPAPARNAPTPHFVTETNDTKWDDCEWASAVMLIEKWTGERVDRRDLRAAAHVAKGGSSLADVARGMNALLDLHLRFSPKGGDPMTWHQLLARLADGGGAIIEGAYSRMPRWYQRWDRKFAASGSVKSAHAVYVERYEPRRHRVWLMDPLGRDGYTGEWISVAALEYFSYTSSGVVHAAATPARLPPVPLKTVRFGQPTLTGQVVAGMPATLVIPIARGRKAPPRLETLRISTAWEPVDSSLPDGPTSAEPRVDNGVFAPAHLVPPAAGPGPAASPGAIDGTFRTPPAGLSAEISPTPPLVTSGLLGFVLRPTGWNLTAQVVVPTEPGRYRLTVTLHNAAGKAIGATVVRPFLPVVVSVTGPYRVDIEAPSRLSVGDRQVFLGITNAGSVAWTEPPIPGTRRIAGPQAITPHVVAAWLLANGTTVDVGVAYAALDPGASATVPLALPLPPPGAVALRLDLMGPDGRLASDLGGRPTLIPFTPRGNLVQDPT